MFLRRTTWILVLGTWGCAARTVVPDPAPSQPVPVVEAPPPPPPRPSLIKSVRGTVVDEQARPVSGAVICDSFDADVMLGTNGVPRVIGLRTPKARSEQHPELHEGLQTACTKTNAQGVFTLQAPTQRLRNADGSAGEEQIGFAPDAEFSVWSGSGLSRTPARSDRMALGIPSLGAVLKLERPEVENPDLGQVVLKPVKPFAVRYRASSRKLLSARLSVAPERGRSVMTLDFADAVPGYPRGKPLPIRAQGEIELPLPVDDTYEVSLEAQAEGEEFKAVTAPEAPHPAPTPVELSVEFPRS